MRRLLFATAALAALAPAVPASAQVYFGARPYGGSVALGGPRDGWRDHDRGWHEHWRGAYAYDCPVVREQFVTPSGHLVIRTHRDCD